MRFLFLMLSLFIQFNLFSQNELLINNVQYGASIKAKINFCPTSKNERKINYRLSTCFGVASKWIVDEIYPAINTEISLYNGGLGSGSIEKNRYCSLDAIIAFTLTSGHLNDNYNRNYAIVNRNVPLKYFGDFAIPALVNPYNYSVSLGTNLVFSTEKNKLFQRLGFLDIQHSGVQFSYYNDGTPFQHLLLGDGKDRYYTGGGSISYSNSFGDIPNLRSFSIELSYHKFTGYSENAFEISNSISGSVVNYSDKNQSFFNKSLWRGTVMMTSENNGIGFSYSDYNSPSMDGQHLIHWLVNNSFHFVRCNRYSSYEPFAFAYFNKISKN